MCQYSQFQKWSVCECEVGEYNGYGREGESCMGWERKKDKMIGLGEIVTTPRRNIFHEKVQVDLPFKFPSVVLWVWL